MIRTVTIVENRQTGAVDYSVNGDLPIEEAAAALVRIALVTELPKKGKNISQDVKPVRDRTG
jgi:hypothetical protein